MANSSPLVMLVAGEASGDQHAASLVHDLRRLIPGVRTMGMGSSSMREAGVDLRFDSSGIGVIGAIEVLKHYGEIRQALALMKRVLREERPDLLICVDYKEFNFQLARYAKSQGVKVLFYVSPQVWAWRQGRVKKYGEAVDHMAVIFPFEEPFYQAHNIPVTYVGHPLAGKVKPTVSKADAQREFGLDAGRPTIGLLPGSRLNEIKRLLPVILESAARLATQFPGVQFLLSQAPTIDDELLAESLKDAPTTLRVVKGRNVDVLQCCDAVITVSGTATLEVALMGVPMVIIYKVNPLTYWLGRLLIQIPFIGLPNILAGRGIVRELIQHDATAVNITDEIGRLLADSAHAERMRADLAEVAEKLGEGGGSAKLAELAAGMIEASHPLQSGRP